MVRIKVECKIRKDGGSVFKIVKDFQNYKNFVKGVQSICILKKNGNKLLTKWQIDFDGAPFCWVEEEVIHEKNKTVVFKSIEGDFYLYCGEWRVIDIGNNNSVIELEAYFNWGIPNLEKFIGEVLEKKARKALRGMVLSFRKAI